MEKIKMPRKWNFLVALKWHPKLHSRMRLQTFDIVVKGTTFYMSLNKKEFIVIIVYTELLKSSMNFFTILALSKSQWQSNKVSTNNFFGAVALFWTMEAYWMFLLSVNKYRRKYWLPRFLFMTLGNFWFHRTKFLHKIIQWALKSNVFESNFNSDLVPSFRILFSIKPSWQMRQIFYIALCIACVFYKRSICTEISPQLKG